MKLRKLGSAERNRKQARADEQGWALLGLLLALGVMSIVLSSSIVPGSVRSAYFVLSRSLSIANHSDRTIICFASVLS